MTNEEKTLVEQYLDYCKQAREANRKANTIKSVLATSYAPHKVGEIIRWTETGRTRKEGYSYKKLPDKDMMAVCVAVNANIDTWSDGDVKLEYSYVFSPLKKDGCISANGCYPRSNYIWTGEFHESMQEKTAKTEEKS